MKQLTVLSWVLFACTVSLGAQSNEALDIILDTPRVTYGQVAYLLLAGDQAIDEESDAPEAVSALEARIGTVVARAANDPLSLGEVSLLVQRYYELPRGLMSNVTASPRYAVRDLRFLRIVQGRSYPGMAVPGERMVRIVRRVMDYREGVL